MIRLDKLLLDRGLVSTRTKAEELISTVGVLVDGKLTTKSGKKFDESVKISLLEEESPYVSRGAHKLLAALENWSIQVAEKTCLDVGASTGGFTQVLLERSPKIIYAVDVGTGQLHPEIKQESRVVNLEKTHVRELTLQLIPEPIDLVVIDVSFISLTKIFPFIHSFIKPGGIVIALVKPQFEVGKDNLGKGGIVKKTQLYGEVISQIKENAMHNQLRYLAHMESPILGGDGNREFLMLLEKI